MRAIQTPLSSAAGNFTHAVPKNVGNFAYVVPKNVGSFARVVPKKVGNFAHTVPKNVGSFSRVMPKKVGNFAHAVPSSVGNGDGPSNEFDCARGCRCAVLLTILFGGIVLGYIALQTPKVKPAETKEEILEEECPSSSTPSTVYRISDRSIGIRKKYVDVGTQKSPVIIFTSDVDSKKKKRKRPRPEGPSGDDQVMSSCEDQQLSSEDKSETGPSSSETSKSEVSSKQKIATKDKSLCEECMRKPVTCVCEKEPKKEREDTCVQPHKRKTRRRRKQSQTSARYSSEMRSISRSRSRRDSRRRSLTSHDSRLSRGSYTSSRSGPRNRRKT